MAHGCLIGCVLWLSRVLFTVWWLASRGVMVCRVVVWDVFGPACALLTA